MKALLVIPAQAGTQSHKGRRFASNYFKGWAPACAGVTLS